MTINMTDRLTGMLLQRREFLVFLITRIGGLLLRPTIIFSAGLLGQSQFAIDYALLTTSISSLFVLTGAQIHIKYYKQRFDHQNHLGYSSAFRKYFRDSCTHIILVIPFVAIAALAWTTDRLLIGLLVIHVVIEKFFDEDQRHFLFTCQYFRWSLSFAARTIVPGSLIIIFMTFLPERIIIFYSLASTWSFLVYLVIRKRYTRFYAKIIARIWREFRSNAKSGIGQFFNRWRNEYSFNQLWSFFSVNFYLLDRLWVANHEGLRLDVYVFFATLFNMVVVGHSILYFTPKRPELIKSDGTTIWREWFRVPNILLPFFLAVCATIVATLAKILNPEYETMFSLVLIIGMAIFFMLQASILVVVETVFWRVSRKQLLKVDILALGLILGFLTLSDPAVPYLPWIMICGALIRLVGYMGLAHFLPARNNHIV